MQQSIVKWLYELNPKKQEVLARRFGLLGCEAETGRCGTRDWFNPRTCAADSGGRFTPPEGYPAQPRVM